MSSGPWTDPLRHRPGTRRLAALCLAAGLLVGLFVCLLVGAQPAAAGEGAGAAGAWLGPRGSVRVGPDGVARSLYRPEFRGAPDLAAQLLGAGLGGLKVDPVAPWLAVPRPPGARADPPPVPGQLLLRGPALRVREALALLARIDRPDPSVFVSILVSEVRGWERESSGVSFLLDKSGGPDPANTILRSYGLEFQPDDFLRSSLTGATPFEGTSLHFADLTTWGGGSFDYVLRMLAKQGDAEFLAWPNLLCSAGVPGTIHALRVVPQQLVDYSNADPAFTYRSNAEVGLKLRVTPRRIGTDSAVLDLDVWLRIPVEIADGTAPIGTLALTERQARTRVTVRDREPLLVGGLTLRTAGRNRRGVPRPSFLSILDPLHSARIVDARWTELVFLVRARVVPACRRPSEVYPDGYAAWMRGRAPDGRALRSPWVDVPAGLPRLDDTLHPPLEPTPSR